MAGASQAVMQRDRLVGLRFGVPAHAAAALWSTVLALALLWPLRHAGYPLGRDMVFTPRPYLSWASVGLGSGAPRAVPLDALVSMASSAVGGAVVGRLALLVPLVVLGTGVAALIGRDRPVAAVIAAGVAVWNPFVVERVGMGAWPLLWAYAALPWIVRCAARFRESGRAAPVLLWAGMASITPTGGVVATAVAATCCWPEGGGWTSRRSWSALVALILALQLPWIVPAFVGPAGLTSDPAGVAAFAARSEHPGGALLSLLGTGGAWNAAAVPASRGGWLAWLTLGAVAVAVALGLRPAQRIIGGTTLRRLGWCAALGLVLAVASSVPGGDAALRWLVRSVPGAGLLRDAQKWLMPYVLLIALLAGCAATRLARLGAARIGCAVGAAVLPVLLLPDAASTVRPVLDPVQYPADWRWAASATGHGGAVLVVPFQPYRSFAWAPGRPVLDPAPRLLPGEVITSDRLRVAGVTLTSEDARVAGLATVLADRRPLAPLLAAEGIGWVLVEKGTPGAVPDLEGLRPVRSGSALELFQVPGAVAPSQPSTSQEIAVLLGDATAVGMLIAAATMTVRRRQR